MKIIKPLIIIILYLFSCSISSTQKASYEKTITDYQAELNAYYFNSIKPLKRSENIKFSGIDFFPIQEKYRVKANFIYTPNGEIVKFNPLCAYSTNFSCPIPPADNFLPIEINAGANYSIL
ncbi:DUF1684 domain-containing protein [Weeksella sp. HMSC059D05]|uniref:DUF1684 domain-containing protein n=1 Tax=Weeksella sp. HMSC059D05 TaxID=1715139 RepID=UPI0008A52267|nr:DUF1684 domain-containing protein [Weeksella sp. HMSC059D05]OFM85334.1 hypothetical protein HMPREF2660_07170 [Weeksella sp. HMSC059D05]